MRGFVYWTITTAVLWLLLSIASTRALECYFCAATGENSPCENYNNYKDAAKCKIEGFRKNCSDDSNTMCTIESHRINGVNIVQMRDCNDGKTFYFTGANVTQIKLDSLYNFGPERNETRCAYDGQYLVCVTKCDTDYCNGPQLDMGTCGGAVESSSKLVVFVMVVFAIAHIITK